MPAPESIARKDTAAEQMEAAYAAAERGDYARALEIWGPLAHAGVARAQSNIGACFANGLGVAPDGTLALRWLTVAAEAGDAVGQRNLATVYFKGELVALDAAAAALRPSKATLNPRTCCPGCWWKPSCYRRITKRHGAGHWLRRSKVWPLQ